jgi:uncharacterized protein YecE (DUF72 family)
MRYDEAYVRAHPFNRLIDGMMSPQMIEDTVEIMGEAIDRGVDIDVIVNNRAGGNAPRIAQKISERFLQAYSQEK